MSQKAWMNAYTKGSKSMQARLAKVHANNPEFQEFVKKHGFGGNLSVKQSGLQKKPSVATVKPVTDPHPERSNLDREAVIKAAAEKLRNRRMANANRVAFGGELGGGFQMPGGGFRRYSESLEESKVEDAIKAHPGVSYYGGKSDDHFVELHKGYEMDGQRSFGNKSAAEAKKMLKHIKKVQATDESVATTLRKVVPGLGKLQAKNRAIDLDNELTAGIQKKTLTRAARMAKAKHIERFARVATGQPAFRKEEKELDKPVKHDAPKPTVLMSKGGLGKTRKVSPSQAKVLAKQGWKPVKEDIAYKDGTIAMYKGGWVAKRDGKRLGTTMPSDKHAKDLLDATRKSLAQKTMSAIRNKAGEVMKSFAKPKLASESAANRNRIRSWDSAVLPVEHDHAMTTPHPKKKLDALRAAGKHVEARELERSWLRKAMAKAKTENSK